MVERQTSALDAVFLALSSAPRRAMLAELAQGPRTVSELAAPHDMSLAAASKHVKTLEKAGLLRREIRWRTHVCSLDPAALAEAHGWLDAYERFWTGRLDRLEELLRQEAEANRPDAGPNPKDPT